VLEKYVSPFDDKIIIHKGTLIIVLWAVLAVGLPLIVNCCNSRSSVGLSEATSKIGYKFCQYLISYQLSNEID
jgi:hypothetical protein